VGGNNWTFSAKDGLVLASHPDTPIKRHVKVRRTASPFNGGWAYWSI